MSAVLSAGAIALLVSLLGTPLFIKFLVKRNYGQFIRQDGPTAHYTKRGTPTMGGVVIIMATLLGYAAANVLAGRMPNASGLRSEERRVGKSVELGGRGVHKRKIKKKRRAEESEERSRQRKASEND